MGFEEKNRKKYTNKQTEEVYNVRNILFYRTKSAFYKQVVIRHNVESLQRKSLNL